MYGCVWACGGRWGCTRMTAGRWTGMMVSWIQSNFAGFGSKIAAPGTGFALQNRGPPKSTHTHTHTHLTAADDRWPPATEWLFLVPGRVAVRTEPAESPEHLRTGQESEPGASTLYTAVHKVDFSHPRPSRAAKQCWHREDGNPRCSLPTFCVVCVCVAGKRPFHTIIPAFAMKDEKPWLAFGVMGGDFQSQGQCQTFLNQVEFGMNPQEAGDAARWCECGCLLLAQPCDHRAGPTWWRKRAGLIAPCPGGRRQVARRLAATDWLRDGRWWRSVRATATAGHSATASRGADSPRDRLRRADRNHHPREWNLPSGPPVQLPPAIAKLPAP